MVFVFVLILFSEACVGGSDRPCHGNGMCDGDGTRGGDGKCSCDHGYEGESCLDCIDGYFSEVRNDTFSLCTGTLPTQWPSSNASYTWGKQQGVNLSSFWILASPHTGCHESCKTCSGATNQDCDECKEGWEEDDQEACVGKRTSKKKSPCSVYRGLNVQVAC